MKCSNFHKIIDRIKLQERKELIKALQVYDGHFSFVDSDEDNRPVITAMGEDFAINVRINSVKVDFDDVQFKCEEMDSSEPYVFWTNDFYAGELSYVINEIPNNFGVNNVSDPAFNIKIDRFIQKLK